MSPVRTVLIDPYYTVDVRGRWRDELRRRIIEDPGRDRFDFYARFTWSFEIREF